MYMGTCSQRVLILVGRQDHNSVRRVKLEQSKGLIVSYAESKCKMSQSGESLLCAMVVKKSFIEEERKLMRL